MSLPQRPLGSSRVMITKTGFGAWAIGGGWAFGWGPQDDAVSLATMRHALKLGVNWIDTAAVYGLGHSEDVVGRLLRERTPAERPMVFITGAIVGGRSPQQVDGWIGAASLELTAADLQEISDAIVRTGAGEGPTIPQLEHAGAAH